MRLLTVICVLFCSLSFAQKNDRKTVQGEWYGNKTLMDPKVGIIKLIRVKFDAFDHGTFLSLKDTTEMRLYYSPMCGNDCIWDYEGKFNYAANKLTLKFNTYNQHGFCKKMSKSYNKTQMKFIFKVEQQGKDTLILTRQSK